MNRRRVAGVTLAVLLAAGGTFGLVSYVQSAKNEAVSQEAQVDVLLVSKLIPKGSDAATIKAATRVGTVQARSKQPGALDSKEAIGTQVAVTDLQPGDQLLAARLATPESLSPEVPADKVQISATLEPERAVGGALKVGDTVGVYLSFDPFDRNEAGEATSSDPTATSTSTAPTRTPNMTQLEFQHVLVTNVQIADEQTKTVDGEEQTALSTSTHYIVTLALTPEQSERFVFASEFGHVWLSQEPASVSDDGTRLVTLGNAFSVVK